MLGKFFGFKLKQPHFNTLDAGGGTEPEAGTGDDDKGADDGKGADGDDGHEDEPKYKVKYNGEEKEIPVSELVTFAQKGMNYDHVKDELEKLRTETGASKKEIETITKALQKYGYEGTPTEIAEVLQAKAQEVPVEDYRQQQAELERQRQEELENDPRYKKMLEHEEAMAAQMVYNQDFMELKGLFPGETAKTLQDIKNFDKFAECRAIGLSVEDAYTLANKDEVLTKKPKQKPTGDDKDHMVKAGGATSTKSTKEIPTESLQMWREAFPEATMAELKEKYNRTFT